MKVKYYDRNLIQLITIGKTNKEVIVKEKEM